MEKIKIKCLCGYSFLVNPQKRPTRGYVMCPKCKRKYRIKPTLMERFTGKKKPYELIEE